MGRFQDLTGKRYGRYTVLERAENKGIATMWRCKCDCGNIRIVSGSSLTTGASKSCGCYKSAESKERHTIHGLCGKTVYNIYRGIKDRCNNPRNRSYKNYGGRGIGICDEWSKNPTAFYEWSMANGWEKGKSIDRIDNDGDYSPDNCRWVGKVEQANNKRNNHFLTFNGERHTFADWERITGISRHTLSARIRVLGWSAEKALTTPTRPITK